MEIETSIEGAGANALAQLEKPETSTPSEPKEPASIAESSGTEKPAGNEPQKVETEINIPKYRFDEVSKKYEEVNKQVQQMAQVLDRYKTFGTPEQVREILASIAKMNTPQAPEAVLDEDDKAMRNVILKLFPNLEGVLKGTGTNSEVAELREQIAQMNQHIQYSQENGKREYNSFIAKANETLRGYAKEIGLNTEDEKNMSILQGSIAQMIEEDKELAERFYANRDVSVLKQVFDDYSKRFFSGVQRKAASNITDAKKITEKLPKQVPAASGIEGEKPVDVKKFKSFNDTTDVVLKLMNEK